MSPWPEPLLHTSNLGKVRYLTIYIISPIIRATPNTLIHTPNHVLFPIQSQQEYALNYIEAAQHPYKLDQVTPMRWIQAAWINLSLSIVGIILHF
jgi:hypothetical protein